MDEKSSYINVQLYKLYKSTSQNLGLQKDCRKL